MKKKKPDFKHFVKIYHFIRINFNNLGISQGISVLHKSFLNVLKIIIQLNFQILT